MIHYFAVLTETEPTKNRKKPRQIQIGAWTEENLDRDIRAVFDSGYFAEESTIVKYYSVDGF